MPRAAARPPDQPGRFWDPRQSHVADETGQSENSPTGHERSWRFFVVALESSDLRAPSAWPIVRHRDESHEIFHSRYSAFCRVAGSNLRRRKTRRTSLGHQRCEVANLSQLPEIHVSSCPICSSSSATEPGTRRADPEHLSVQSRSRHVLDLGNGEWGKCVPCRGARRANASTCNAPSR